MKQVFIIITYSEQWVTVDGGDSQFFIVGKEYGTEFETEYEAQQTAEIYLKENSFRRPVYVEVKKVFKQL